MAPRTGQSATVVHASPRKSDGLDQLLATAISRHHAGDAAGAEQLYRTILTSPLGHAVASFGFGLLCGEQGRLSEAVENYRQAIATQPDFVDAWINLGTAVLTLGRHQEALALYRRAIEIRPQNAMAHGNLGKALQDMGRTDEAVAAYRAAIALEPDNAITHANLGAVLLERQEWDDSATITRRAIALRPDSAMAHANLGTALMHLGRHEEALAACRQAMASRPEGVAIHASLGGAMLELGALPEAVTLCRQAIALDPALASAHFNLSHALKAMNFLDEAILSARQAIALCPASAEYHFHLAHILLLRGDLDTGWVEYDWRWQLPDFAWINQLHGTFSQPPWTGEDISGKTLLIYTEQGLGDIILFARYLPLAVRRAGRVIVAAHPSTRRLLESVEGISVVSIRDVPLPDFDAYCPLLSLPRAFATRLDSIPSAVPYLAVPVVAALYGALRRASGRDRLGWESGDKTRSLSFARPDQCGAAIRTARHRVHRPAGRGGPRGSRYQSVAILCP